MSDNEIRQANARSKFHEWEDKKFPEGDSTYSDDDINIWVLGYLEGQEKEE